MPQIRILRRPLDPRGRMLVPVVQQIRQRPDIARLKQRVVAAREEPRRAPVRVADDGHKSAADRLGTGNRFNLYDSGVDVQVGSLQDVQKLLPREESELTVQTVLLCQPEVVLAPGTVPGKDQPDIVPVAAQSRRAEQLLLRLLRLYRPEQTTVNFPFSGRLSGRRNISLTPLEMTCAGVGCVAVSNTSRMNSVG